MKSDKRPISVIFRIGAICLLALSMSACNNNADSASHQATSIPNPISVPSAEPSPTLTPSDLLTGNDLVATGTIKDGSQESLFDGVAAYNHLLAQMDLGPRWPGSEGHAAVREYIVDHLENEGWVVERQNFDYQTFHASNLIGRKNVGAGPVIIIGAHYDTRKIADQSPNTTSPVPGAVDGASGVAVLLELATALETDQIENEIWLVFFDIEDNGNGSMAGFDWIAGSTYMAQNLEVRPQAMVLADMIGDADQQLYYEGNSDPNLQELLWQIAAELGYGEYFIPVVRHSMLDDHLPFARLGIPAVDIIDFDYPYWHTIEDTADKASPDSLLRVGRTLERWLEERING